jgi:hypothetical protein
MKGMGLVRVINYCGSYHHFTAQIVRLLCSYIKLGDNVLTFNNTDRYNVRFAEQSHCNLLIHFAFLLALSVGETMVNSSCRYFLCEALAL